MVVPFVIGLGSYHGDDRAGWLAVDQLANLGYPAQYLHCARSPVELLNLALNERSLIICDAFQFVNSESTILQRTGIGGRDNEDSSEDQNDSCDAGICRLLWPTDKIVYRRGIGSHDLELAEVLELGNALRSTPPNAEIWTIPGCRWTPGTDPSAAVRIASHQVAQRIWSSCHRA